eukprot:1189679-Prorocentrum_minimum.AAC.1
MLPAGPPTRGNPIVLTTASTSTASARSDRTSMLPMARCACHTRMPDTHQSRAATWHTPRCACGLADDTHTRGRSRKGASERANESVTHGAAG